MNILIAKRSSQKTVSEIIDGLNVQVYYSKDKMVNPVYERPIPKCDGKDEFLSPEENHIAIRWGCTTPIPPEFNIVYNEQKAVRNASNKRIAREIMAKADIPIPRGSSTTPCIGRPDYHFGGKHFFFCQTERDVRKACRKGASHFMSFYPKTKEYRVHVAHGKALVVSEKTGLKKGTLIWNYRINGAYFKILRWRDYPLYVIKPAVAAVEALGLDFGAVDVMANPKDSNLPRAVVSEVNTAPLVEDYCASRYKEYFAFLLRGNKRKEHFDGEKVGYRFRHRELAT